MRSRHRTIAVHRGPAVKNEGDTYFWGGRAGQRGKQGHGRRRPTSHLPVLADLLVTTPVLSASQAGTALRITSHLARALLSALEKRGLIHEVTGRASFRFYTPTPFLHLR